MTLESMQINVLNLIDRHCKTLTKQQYNGFLGGLISELESREEVVQNKLNELESEGE